MTSRTAGRAKRKLRSLLWKLHRLAGETATFRTRHGILTVDTSDRTIARSLYCNRAYELDWMLEVASHLRSTGHLPAKGRGTVVDLGANMGVTSVGWLHVGEFERAIAVEPDPRNFALLERNLAQNGFASRAVCLQCAVGDRDGVLAFERSDTNFGDHRVRLGAPGAAAERFGESSREVIEVQCRTLDGLLSSLPVEFTKELALVWMDVQGFEAHVLRGGPRTFGTGVALATEVWPYGLQRAGTTPEEFCGLVRGYYPHYWIARGPKRAPRFVRYPTEMFHTVFDEVGFEGAYENVLFTRS